MVVRTYIQEESTLPAQCQSLNARSKNWLKKQYHSSPQKTKRLFEGTELKLPNCSPSTPVSYLSNEWVMLILSFWSLMSFALN